MGKLRVLSGAEVCRILREHGFVKVRQRGSHVVMQRRAPGTVVTVPVHTHIELKAGTLSAIVRQSGLPRALFEE